MRYKTLFLFLLFCLFANPSFATFTMVQHDSLVPTCSDSQHCNITVTSTGSGNLLVLEITTESNVTVSSLSGGGSWVVPSNCQALDNGWPLMIQCAYVLSSTSGATTISVVFSSSEFHRHWEFIEYSYTNGPVSVDNQGVINNQDNPGANPNLGWF